MSSKFNPLLKKQIQKLGLGLGDAQNGLSVNTDKVELGGTLIKDTTISFDQFELALDLSASTSTSVLNRLRLAFENVDAPAVGSGGFNDKDLWLIKNSTQEGFAFSNFNSDQSQAMTTINSASWINARFYIKSVGPGSFDFYGSVDELSYGASNLEYTLTLNSTVIYSSVGTPPNAFNYSLLPSAQNDLIYNVKDPVSGEFSEITFGVYTDASGDYLLGAYDFNGNFNVSGNNTYYSSSVDSFVGSNSGETWSGGFYDNLGLSSLNYDLGPLPTGVYNPVGIFDIDFTDGVNPTQHLSFTSSTMVFDITNTMSVNNQRGIFLKFAKDLTNYFGNPDHGYMYYTQEAPSFATEFPLLGIGLFAGCEFVFNKNFITNEYSANLSAQRLFLSTNETYLNSKGSYVDDTSYYSPQNVLYTDNNGQILSSPVNKLSISANLQNKQIAFGDSSNLMTSTSNLTYDEVVSGSGFLGIHASNGFLSATTGYNPILDNLDAPLGSITFCVGDSSFYFKEASGAGVWKKWDKADRDLQNLVPTFINQNLLFDYQHYGANKVGVRAPAFTGAGSTGYDIYLFGSDAEPDSSGLTSIKGGDVILEGGRSSGNYNGGLSQAGASLQFKSTDADYFGAPSSMFKSLETYFKLMPTVNHSVEMTVGSEFGSYLKFQAVRNSGLPTPLTPEPTFSLEALSGSRQAQKCNFVFLGKDTDSASDGGDVVFKTGVSTGFAKDGRTFFIAEHHEFSVRTGVGSYSTAYDVTNQSNINMRGVSFQKKNYISSSYSVAPNDHIIIVDTATSANTLNLPTYTQFIDGQEIIVKDKSGNAQTNNITINTAGAGEFIDDANSFVINSDYGFVRLIVDYNHNGYLILGA